MKDLERRRKELEGLLKKYDEAYYRNAKPEISDQQYDRLRQEFDSMGSQDDLLGLFSGEEGQLGKEKGELVPVVGDDRLEEFESHIHISPMLSLDNTYDEEEFFEFNKRLCKILEKSWES